MIIWRGWGGLALGIPLLLVGIALGVASAMKALDSLGGVFVAVAGILGAVLAYFVGIRLNRTKPEQQLDEWTRTRTDELRRIVDQAPVQLSPQFPVPTSREEAHAQVDLLVAQERAQVRPRFLDRHTLFFIPMQWAALLVGVGVAALGVTLSLQAH